MSYQEKRTIVSIVSGFLVIVGYSIFVSTQVSSGIVSQDDLYFWAVSMLKFIGIGILATIILQILFHIAFSVEIAVKNKINDEHFDDKKIEKLIAIETLEDERDKQIELKSLRVGYVIAGTGFIAALASIVGNGSPALMLNILFYAFSVGSLLEGILQLYHYRKGA